MSRGPVSDPWAIFRAPILRSKRSDLPDSQVGNGTRQGIFDGDAVCVAVVGTATLSVEGTISARLPLGIFMTDRRVDGEPCYAFEVTGPTYQKAAEVRAWWWDQGPEWSVPHIAPRTYGLRTWPASKLVPPSSSGRLTNLDAAEKVLDDEGSTKPMHYRRITELAIERGYLETNGLTPQQTMYVQLITDVKRRQQQADEPRFFQLPKGLLGLARWVQNGLVAEIAKHNKQVKEDLLKRLRKMEPYDFEKLHRDSAHRGGLRGCLRHQTIQGRRDRCAGVPSSPTRSSGRIWRSR